MSPGIGAKEAETRIRRAIQAEVYEMPPNKKSVA
jgi:hypothetical protein